MERRNKVELGLMLLGSPSLMIMEFLELLDERLEGIVTKVRVGKLDCHHRHELAMALARGLSLDPSVVCGWSTKLPRSYPRGLVVRPAWTVKAPLRHAVGCPVLPRVPLATCGERHSASLGCAPPKKKKKKICRGTTAVDQTDRTTSKPQTLSN